MTTVQTIEIREIAPEDLVPDPKNPRGKLREIDALASNIKAHGILEPLVVREVNGTLQIMAGHRRQAAAIKAKLKTVPYRIATVEDERNYALQRLVTNTQRDDLSPVEHAQGVQQVLDLGMTADEVAAGLSVPVENIAHATTIAKSKSAAKVVEKHADLSFDQVLGLAEFEGDKDIFDHLMHVATDTPEEWPYEIENYRQERERTRKYEELAKVWQDRGFKTQAASLTYGSNERYVNKLKGADGKAMSDAEHADCPGRAIHLAINYGTSGIQFSEFQMCTDFVANGHEELDRTPAGTRAVHADRTGNQQAADEKASKDRKINLAMINAGKVAEVVRRDFTAKLITRKSPPAGMLRFASDYLVGRRYGLHRGFDEMLGKLTEEKYGRMSRRVGATKRLMNSSQELVADVTEARLPLALFAIAAAEIEGDWEANTWKLDSQERADYLNFLVSCGYTMSLVEKVTAGKAKAEDVWNDQEARKAAKKSGSTKAAAPTKSAPAKKAAPTKKRAPAKKTAKKVTRRAPAKKTRRTSATRR